MRLYCADYLPGSSQHDFLLAALCKDLHPLSEAEMSSKNVPAPAIGWPLLPRPDKNGNINYPDLETSVREMIEIILRTRPGEQLMRGTFGAGLENYLHESNTLSVRRRVRDLVKEALERWEKRILLDRVDVREVPQHSTHLRVEIFCRLRRTGAPAQVSLVMQLGS